MTRTLNWEPVRMGAIYCSSACGHNCTHKAYSKACSDADVLVAQLGDNWEPRVWENLGWWCEAKHKVEPISVSKYGSSYTCYYNAEIQQLGNGSTALEAYDNAVQGMVGLRDELTRSLGALS